MPGIQKSVTETKEIYDQMIKLYYLRMQKLFKDYNPKWSKEFKERYATKCLVALIEKNREIIDIMKIEVKLIKKDIYRAIQEEKGMKRVDIGKMIRGMK